MSNPGCELPAFELVQKASKSDGSGQRKLKRLLQAIKDGGSEVETGYVMRMVFVRPEECDLWTIKRCGEVIRARDRADETHVVVAAGEEETVLAA